ncbi:M14 family zinc carboxypeptidase [Variovorax sp. RHLX14]|uniref:M14 family zinc carboxypeptidase n=1 Tax=Variovorax sp. RHLX14 TaxID=1259731 RepID=UPI003F44960E
MTMTLLLDKKLPRTLDAWVAELSAQGAGAPSVEAWLFDGAIARRAAEKRLAAAGIRARFRSAYKPLVHHFEEEVDIDGLASVVVRYPVHPGASPRRFALESYPLADMLAGVTLQLQAKPESDAVPRYEVELRWRNGAHRIDTVFAPNRFHEDLLGNAMLSPCGWFDGAQKSTDYEEIFQLAMHTLHHHDWPKIEPYFERLDIRVDLPDSPRPPGSAWIDLHEAMHEDLYFSLLETFQQRSGRPLGDRRLQPGQIVPDVRASIDGGVSVRIALRAYPKPAVETESIERIDVTSLADVVSPLSPARIAREMAAIGGVRFEALTRQGRQVLGVHRATGKPLPAVIVSGGQHANETSGVVGALRAAHTLAARADANFALIALENPDGYALRHELCAHGPAQREHMQHAARYTALGDDLEYREQPPFYEREARHQAFALSRATLHVNLHGYPAHEWTRPLSGYIPRGFDLWTVPKGFFLILRHLPGWSGPARQLAEHVCRRLAERADLMAFNAAQLATYNRHAGELPFEVIHGTACTISEVDRPGPALTLITEFPDETVHGDPFILAHDTQTATVLAAVEALSFLPPSP